MTTFGKWTAAFLIVLASFAAGVVSAQAQFLPPPPAINLASDPTFTATDRARLVAIYRMVRAMHTRLFPLAEEQKILNGGSVENISP